MSQLLIEQGFGKGSGDTISLIHLRSCEPHPELETILLSFSCYPPALPKIRTCLRRSRRYDCEVQSWWFRKQAGRLEAALAQIDIELRILRFTNDGFKPNLKDFKGVRP